MICNEIDLFMGNARNGTNTLISLGNGKYIEPDETTKETYTTVEYLKAGD